ncbi:MAG: cysteine desulfurase NifS [Acidobacteria bacterium]|nr:MAG: cysteine desulfurase NifS [Chloroflexi bacterium 13_1_40CM_55_7]OLD19523.1 MAG: cysteine desulfurase NifS [Acidobacteriales bacterium 13_1_40CM_3_55_5]PYX02855.1 MAG: cysteine desulfurase NifS [Acidobacteriota bacterium]PYX06376.1 MAG: cysteine desulfurase NifS [Acidobacteriota bacterium]PYX18338.1 MAG: cysteine desulfurase NifS [Acidobacteriota bacterium]
MRRVYFDNNASTPVLSEVFDAMRPYFGEHFGNASSIHHHGQDTRAAVERARESLATLVGCRPSEIVFTSGGTEGDNLAIFGLARSGDHVISSTIEHHAVLNACKHLEEMGCEVTYIPVDGSGQVDPDDVRRVLRANTRLITIMMANNETGVLQPVEEIGKIAAEADVYFHTDGVQAAGKVPLDVNRIGCDLLSISGHKMHAPQGVGALYVRKGTLLQPMLYGGRHERSRRAGTENVPGIVALGKAAELAQETFQRGDDKTMAASRDRIQQTILENVEATGLNGEGAARVPNTTNIYFEYIEGEALVIALDLKGLAVSTGAACSSGAIEPSHVLTAMGLRPDRARASIRFSLGKQNTPEEVDFALDLVPQTVSRLRELSPVYNKTTVSS